MSEGWHRNRRVNEVLDDAEVLYLAVAASKGPHVTPAVFDVDGDRLWFITPRRSVKARVIDRAKDLETDARDAVKDAIDDDESDEKASSPDMGDLQVALAELTAKVNKLAELQLASASAANSTSSSTAARRSTSAAA